MHGHRQGMRENILSVAAAMVAEQGLLGVSMSQIAERAGIGRATLYRYFPDAEAVLHAWHEQHVSAHLRELTSIRNTTPSSRRLHAVLETYALHTYRAAAHQAPELVAQLHSGQHVRDAHGQLHRLLTDVLAEDAAAGRVRTDTKPSELATYCLHALSAAARMGSAAAVRRLVTVTQAGLG